MRFGTVLTYTGKKYAYAMRKSGGEYFICRVPRSAPALLGSEYLTPDGWKKSAICSWTPSWEKIRARWDAYIGQVDEFIVPPIGDV